MERAALSRKGRSGRRPADRPIDLRVKTPSPVSCALFVYTKLMKNITLSADEALIESGRRRAEAENTTLNNLFREWLAQYARPPRLSPEDVRRTAAAVGHFRAGRRFTRDERNER